MRWIDSYATYVAMFCATVSAVCWVVSSVVRSRVKPHRVVLTLEKEEFIDLHNLALTLQLQSVWNRWAAVFAALTLIFQVIAAK